MILNVYKPTYKFGVPVRFMEKEVDNSLHLVQLLLDHWSLAVAFFRAGFLNDFATKHQPKSETGRNGSFEDIDNFYKLLWGERRDYSADVLFTKVIYLIEPQMDEMPILFLSEDGPRLCDKSQVQYQFRGVSRIIDCHMELSECVTEDNFTLPWDGEYSEDAEKGLYYLQMLREKVFSYWGWGNAEAKFTELCSYCKSHSVRAYEIKESLGLCVFALEHDFSGRELFCYEDKYYGSLEDFYSVWSGIEGWRTEEIDRFAENLLCGQTNPCWKTFEEWLKYLDKNRLADDVKVWLQQWKNFRKQKLPTGHLYNSGSMSIPDLTVFFQKQSRNQLVEMIDQMAKAARDKVEMGSTARSYYEADKTASTLYRNFVTILYQSIGKSCPERIRCIESMESHVASAEKKISDNTAECKEVISILEAVKSGTVLRLWNQKLINKYWPDKSEVPERSMLFLLNCIPVEEEYENRCTEAMQFIETYDKNKDTGLEHSLTEYFFVYLVKPLFECNAPKKMLNFYLKMLGFLDKEVRKKANIYPDRHEQMDWKKELVQCMGKEISLPMPDTSYQWSAYEVTKHFQKNSVEERYRSTLRFPFKRIYEAWIAKRNKLVDANQKWRDESQRAKFIPDAVLNVAVESCPLESGTYFDDVKREAERRWKIRKGEIIKELSQREQEWKKCEKELRDFTGIADFFSNHRKKIIIGGLIILIELVILGIFGVAGAVKKNPPDWQKQCSTVLNELPESAPENLTSIYLENVEEVGSYTFSECKELETVTLPRAKEVCMSAFYGCTELREVYLPKVETIYINKSMTMECLYLGGSLQEIIVQLVPESGTEEMVLEKHRLTIVLDKNGVYSEQALNTLYKMQKYPERFGEVELVYEDFTGLNME